MRGGKAFLGIDLGTTGVRAVLADEAGFVIATQASGVEASFVECADDTHSEQDPRMWPAPLFQVLKKVLPALEGRTLEAVCVDSTSGTVIPVDRDGNPLGNALLHNDIRGHEEAKRISSATGLDVKPSFALSKILWIKNRRPDLYERTFKFLHAADYVKGLVSGDFGSTDFSNAVKTCYDLVEYRWPASIESALGISLDKLPMVAKTGEVVGTLKRDIREEFGIRNEVKVVAGATDSTTSFFSSGARDVGDWNTNVGTVLGIRGVAERFIRDPDGLLYTHRHPEGYWLPGAASNTGGEAVRLFFKNDLKALDKKIEALPPTGSLIYPLARKSEKFPFLNLDAAGFVIMEGCDPVLMFKGFLEGVAYVERMIYEKIAGIGYKVGDRVFSMGGGAYSLPWMRIRASVLKRSVYRAKEVETAFGAAVIAASGVHYKSLTEAIARMVSVETSVEPDEKNARVYDELYARFVEECKKRKFF
jgi:sugar (pentulose or hexulose) kinase